MRGILYICKEKQKIAPKRTKKRIYNKKNL